MVAKVLHQTARTLDDLHPLQASFSEECKRLHLHDGWQFKFWTDADIDEFVFHHYPSLYPSWRQLSPAIKRVDTVRYLWMHHFGGVYLDTDVECLQSMQRLLDRFDRSNATTIFFSPRIGPSIMISSPQHPFWLWAANKIVQQRANKSIFKTAGPLALQALLGRWLSENESALIWLGKHNEGNKNDSNALSTWQTSILQKLHLPESRAHLLERSGSFTSQIAFMEDGYLLARPNCRGLGGRCRLRHCHNARATVVPRQDRLLVHHCLASWGKEKSKSS